MMLNKAFQKAAGLINPATSEATTKNVLTAFDADISHLRPRDAARKMARSATCKNASLDGNRLPFSERAKYLQEIIERARRKESERNSVLAATRSASL